MDMAVVVFVLLAGAAVVYGVHKLWEKKKKKDLEARVKDLSSGGKDRVK